MTKNLEKNVKLTQFSKGAGWASKLSPKDLTQVLSKLKMHIPKGVIGFDTSEDCSVFPINDNEYLIQSVDFFFGNQW